jgi:hypothetical protein
MAITIRSLVDETGVDVWAYDDGGLPWLVWDEDRPQGKRAAVGCSIYANDNDELLFETDGSLMSASMYRSRLWEKLVGFRAVPASELYFSGMEKRIQQELMNNWMLFRLYLPNDAVVMTAEFADGHSSVPMHLNYGVGTPVEIAELHDALYRRFIGERKAILDAVCDGEFKWPRIDSERRAKIMARERISQRAFAAYRRKNSFWGRLFGR